MYAVSKFEFQALGEVSSSIFYSNTAGSRGGAIFTWHSLQVKYGHKMIVYNNTAGIDGGGVFSATSVPIEIQGEGCPAALCEKNSPGNGQCDPACMTRGCNW